MDKPDRVEEPDFSDEHDLRFWIWFAAIVGAPVFLWYGVLTGDVGAAGIFTAAASGGPLWAQIIGYVVLCAWSAGSLFGLLWLAREQFRLHRERRATRSGSSAGT